MKMPRVHQSFQNAKRTTQILKLSLQKHVSRDDQNQNIRRKLHMSRNIPVRLTMQLKLHLSRALCNQASTANVCPESLGVPDSFQKWLDRA